jgi:[acyl-carrier-protein] S-malonyltransferase
MMSALAEEFQVVEESFAEASEILGYDLLQVCRQGPVETLNKTEVTQPAMLASGVATWRAWRAAGGADPDCMAGHSLGEYSALVAAGVLDFDSAVAAVARRGKFMQDATPEGIGAMAAILGLEDAVLAEICVQLSNGETVSCANFNAPGQVVIAGHAGAVEKACERAREAGARRAIPLPVSVPSHSVLMKPAAEAMAETLAGMDLHEARVDVVQNADVAVHRIPAAVRDALARQLWQPVRWTETIQSLLDRGVTRFVECGPGKVLAGLNRRISRGSEMVTLTDSESLSAALVDGKEE